MSMVSAPTLVEEVEALLWLWEHRSCCWSSLREVAWFCARDVSASRETILEMNDYKEGWGDVYFAVFVSPEFVRASEKPSGLNVPLGPGDVLSRIVVVDAEEVYARLGELAPEFQQLMDRHTAISVAIDHALERSSGKGPLRLAAEKERDDEHASRVDHELG